MAINYEEIKRANDAIATLGIEVKGKTTEYAPVNQRIKAFRMLYPQGFITTEMIANAGGICIFRATVGYEENGAHHVLGTGTAYEKESSSFINKTSYIENCETSAVGRALGMAGFGIDCSVASAEEVQTAILNQEKQEADDRAAIVKATPKQVALLKALLSDERMAQTLQFYRIEKIEDISLRAASAIIERMKGEQSE